MRGHKPFHDSQVASIYWSHFGNSKLEYHLTQIIYFSNEIAFIVD